MFQTALLYLVSWYKRQLHVTMIFIYMYYNHGGLINACLVSVTFVISYSVCGVDRKPLAREDV